MPERSQDLFGIARFCVTSLGLSACVVAAQTSYPIAMTSSGSLDDVQRAQVANGSITGVANAKALIDETFKLAGVTEPKKFACIIHVVNWNWVDSGPATSTTTGTLGTGGPDTMQVTTTQPKKLTALSSKWYVYDTTKQPNDADFAGVTRIYGNNTPYVLTVHMGLTGPVGQRPFTLDYQYQVVTRLPANVQDLTQAIDIYSQLVTQTDKTGVVSLAAANVDLSFWTIGQVSGAKPPSNVTVIAAIHPSFAAVGAANDQDVDKTPPVFDDEGFYWWDVSVGVPITSYTQLESVSSTTGTQVPANLNQRNLLALVNVFIPPADLSAANFLAVPHAVAGLSFASKPLHNAFAGLAWGPAIANFYVGAMIVTSNVSATKTKTNYKLGFGLNFPVRTIAAKLGVKSQVK
jgi:hypothetical protein